MRCPWWILLLILLAPLAHAADVRAFLDRTHVSLGDTVTLNIQSDGNLDTPDLSSLQQDFQVLGTSRSSSMQIVNGKTTSTSQLGIALKPLRAGTLTIPSLDVGGARTRPLTLQVGAAPSGGNGKVGDPVFMETSVLSSSPYVGQQTVYTVRLFYLPGVDGSLSDPVANGARLVKLDRDHDYTVDRNGYTYKVIEYEWALIPQKSGSITVQGPAFQGQNLAVGNPGAFFNNPNALLNNPNALMNGQIPGFGKPANATAPATRLDVRAMPANAGKPWLPAREVDLKLSGLPANGQVSAGVPLTVTLSISASGQPADALPEPELPSIPGARVYPDQTRDATDDSGQWLRGTRTRNFAIVPQRNGKLSLPAITLDWWDVVHDRAMQASVPARTLQVSGGVPATSSAMSSIATTASSIGHPLPASSSGKTAVAATSRVATAEPGFWRILALASLALWLIVVISAWVWWWLRRKSAVVQDRGEMRNARDESSGSPGQPAMVDAAKPDRRTLQRQALDAARRADAAACERALLAWAHTTHTGIVQTSALRDALSDPAQRDALDDLQRARWRGGDVPKACAAAVDAFANGFAWRDHDKPARGHDTDLPPLYPARD
jgi:BatD DUF11 like domain